MSKYKWIKDQGMISNEELIDKLLKCEKKGNYFLAYSTDSFRAGRVEKEQIEQLNCKKVLEVRIFSETEETCFRRSSIGEDFQWRTASEEGLSAEVYMIQYQTLDMNKKRIGECGNPKDSYGNKILYTTVGGKYVLPVADDADSSKIITYIDYDENGIAKCVDYRICGFVQKLGKDKVM